MKAKLLVGLVVTLFISAITFIILDMALGEPMSLECSVTGKYYVPPQVNVSVDAEGDVSVDTDPEEFHVTVDEVSGARTYDIHTTKHFYATLTNSQIIRVNARLGKWTQSVHIGAIEP